MTTITDPKQAAARAALDELPREGIVGLGSGSTARIFVEELGALVRAGRRITGVATSDATRALAASVGIPLLSDDGPWSIDVNVDGADEVSAKLDLIKGGGGAHAREKIVNFAAARNVIIVDASKLSGQLGEKWSVPVEVLVFGHAATAARLASFGRPVLRVRGDAPVRTDAGNLIYDVATGPIAHPGTLDAAIHSAAPGVVATGLFVGRTDVVIVADSGAVRRILPPRR